MINELYTKNRISKTKYIALPNAEDPRVILPLANKRLFKKGFEIHNTSSPSNRLLKKIAVSFSFLLPYIHSKILYPTQKLNELIEAIKKNIDHHEISSISGYVGTKNSANQKLTLMLLDSDNEIIGIAKIASSYAGKKYLMNEVNICNKLSGLELERIITPRIHACFEYKELLVVVEADIFDSASQIDYNLSSGLIDSYIELKSKTNNMVNHGEYIKRMYTCCNSLNLIFSVQAGIIKSIENISKINFTLMLQHGDFVPYNIKVGNKKYALIDWEFAREDGQPFYDLFHFIYQGKHRILEERHEDLVMEIMENSSNHSLLSYYFEIIGVEIRYMEDFFMLYLVEALEYEKLQRSDFILHESHFYKGIIHLQSIKK